jgi:hypothetical protein
MERGFSFSLNIRRVSLLTNNAIVAKSVWESEEYVAKPN